MSCPRSRANLWQVSGRCLLLRACPGNWPHCPGCTAPWALCVPFTYSSPLTALHVKEKLPAHASWQDSFPLGCKDDTVCFGDDKTSIDVYLFAFTWQILSADFEMMGLGNGRRSMKSPPLVLAALVACIIVLGFNYWIASSRSVDLQVFCFLYCYVYFMFMFCLFCYDGVPGVCCLLPARAFCAGHMLVR